MRKVFIASVGTLLVLFLATSGYPAQGTAAVQASGDITLHFGIQHEFDFEIRDNYDLDNGLIDGCSGPDCSGVGGTNPVVSHFPDGFVTQETRLIIQGSQGDIWKSRVTLEGEAAWEDERIGDGAVNEFGIERAWADIKLYDTPVHVKTGLIWDQLDPFRMVWSDDETGIKIYATHGNISWAIWYIKESEAADGADNLSGRDSDQDYYLARVDLDFGSFQVSPMLSFVRNRSQTSIIDTKFARGVNGDFATGLVSVDENVIYPGVIARGTFGPVSFVGEFAAALGEIGDDSAVDAQREQDVSAFMVAVDVGVKLGAWTPHAGFIYASGDDNPHDADAEAWDGIASDNENLLGSRGIIMDDRVKVLNIHDDSITANTVNPTARQFGLQPGLIAVFAGLKGRPTKKIKTDLNLIYFQWDKERQWEFVDGIVTRQNCSATEAASGAGVCSNAAFTNGVADETGLVETVDDEMGWELNGQVTYIYNKHVTLTIAAAVFWPGDGAEVVAQCFNAGSQLETSCGELPEDFEELGDDFEKLTNDRADDEAFNIEVELLVQF